MITIEFDKVITTAQSKTIPSNALGIMSIAPVYDCNTHKNVRGKVMLSFRMSIDSTRNAIENHKILIAEAPLVQAWFPSYRVPSLAQIESHLKTVHRMTASIKREGAIAERSLPSPLIGMMGKWA